MMARKLKKRIWALGTQILFPYKLRAYRAWEIAGTQDTAPDTKTKFIIPYQYFHNTPIDTLCQHKFYHKFKIIFFYLFFKNKENSNIWKLQEKSIKNLACI
ncbi:hypothetical protein CEV08_02835 [Bartonella tribocorum]|uniref:Uncharacterized protein n=1 Tax=Bartonella tribocorum TaxID=85701 RepID=A0A2M6UWX5_9HYPH|nr:hypothetical protein CEV08_02835 [Bartonella tribocorum]